MVSSPLKTMYNDYCYSTQKTLIVSDMSEWNLNQYYKQQQ